MASQITPVTRGFSMWMPPFWAATSGAQGCCESRHDDRHRTPRQNGGAAPALSRTDLRFRATLPAFGATRTPSSGASFWDTLLTPTGRLVRRVVSPILSTDYGRVMSSVHLAPRQAVTASAIHWMELFWRVQ